MSISFDTALGIHQQALSFRSQRAEVLANNLANADTPNYKARDMDFASVLAAQSGNAQRGNFATTLTNPAQIQTVLSSPRLTSVNTVPTTNNDGQNLFIPPPSGKFPQTPPTGSRRASWRTTRNRAGACSATAFCSSRTPVSSCPTARSSPRTARWAPTR